MKKQLNITISGKLFDDLTTVAKDIGVSRSQLIEDLIILGQRTVIIDKYDEVLKDFKRYKDENA